MGQLLPWGPRLNTSSPQPLHSPPQTHWEPPMAWLPGPLRLTCCGGGRVYTGTVKAGLPKVAEGCGEQGKEPGSHREQRPQLGTQGSLPPRKNTVRAMHCPAPLPSRAQPRCDPHTPSLSLVEGAQVLGSNRGRLGLNTSRLTPQRPRASGPGSSSRPVPGSCEFSDSPPQSLLLPPWGSPKLLAGWPRDGPGSGDAVLTAKCGCLGVAAEAMGLAGWQGWMVGPGAPPLAGTPCPSWNRGLDSPLAVVGAALLGRKHSWSVCPGLGLWARDSGAPMCVPQPARWGKVPRQLRGGGPPCAVESRSCRAPIFPGVLAPTRVWTEELCLGSPPLPVTSACHQRLSPAPRPAQ